MKNLTPNERLFAQLRVVHDRATRSAAANMAVDEALLQTATQPVLRFYGWRQPARSFGYFGCFVDVAAQAPERELVRRWTGGGIVLHGSDLTYSVILPRSAFEKLPSPQTIYRVIHGAIQQALGDGMDIALAGADAPKISDACFANAVAADVLIEGRKIAGAAQRRTRAGLLHQGSIQNVQLPASFPNAFAAALCVNYAETTLDPDVIRQAEMLAAQKYDTLEWLRQR
ncbi:MAG: hypothetical protein ABIR71_01385 [Chthoniobacterales bacterium]